MNKFIIFLIVAMLNAESISKIKIIVENEPITNMDIQIAMEQIGVAEKEAIDALIIKTLRNITVKKNNIVISDSALKARIKQIASRNQLNELDFQLAVLAKGITWTDYRKNIKQQLENEDFGRVVLRQEFVAPDNAEIRYYYDSNLKDFQVSDSFVVKKFISKDKNALQAKIANPLMNEASVQSETEHLGASKLPVRLSTVFEQTPLGNFTPVMQLGDDYMAFLIEEKRGKSAKEFNAVRSEITTKLNQAKRAKAITSYFQKEKAKADIRYIEDISKNAN